MRGEYYTLTRWSSRGFRPGGGPSQFYEDGYSGAWGLRLGGAAPAPPPPDRHMSTSAAAGHTIVCRRPSRRHTPPTSSSCLYPLYNYAYRVSKTERHGGSRPLCRTSLFTMLRGYLQVNRDQL